MTGPLRCGSRDNRRPWYTASKATFPQGCQCRCLRRWSLGSVGGLGPYGAHCGIWIKSRRPGPVLEGHDNTVNAAVFSDDGCTACLFCGIWWCKSANGESVKRGDLVRARSTSMAGGSTVLVRCRGTESTFTCYSVRWMASVGLVSIDTGVTVSRSSCCSDFESVRCCHWRPLAAMRQHGGSRAVVMAFINVWDMNDLAGKKYAHQFTEGPVWALAICRHDGKGNVFRWPR